MRVLSALLLLVALGGHARATEGPLERLVGVWRLAAFSIEWVGTGERAHWIKHRPLAHVVVTPTGWFSLIVTAKFRKETGRVEQSSSGLLSLIPYNGPITVEGNLLIVRVHAAAQDELAGTDQVREFEVRGGDLIVLRTLPKPVSSSADRRARSVLVFRRE